MYTVELLVEVDVQEAFYNLSAEMQKKFILDQIRLLSEQKRITISEIGEVIDKYVTDLKNWNGNNV